MTDDIINVLREEIAWLRQGLWDCARAAGVDLDGDSTPLHQVFPDIVTFSLESVRDLMKAYEEALDLIDLRSE